MALPEHHRENFNTLIEAAKANRLALMQCTDAETGEDRAVICAVNYDGNDYIFMPFGHLSEGNPFDIYLPPGDE